MFLMKEKDKVYEAKFILYLVRGTFSENVASFRMDTIGTSQPNKNQCILVHISCLFLQGILVPAKIG